MKKTFFTGIAFIALALTSCGNDSDDNTQGGGNRVALQVTSGIQTRASGNTWDKGDGIGIFSTDAAGTYANVEYTTASGDGAFAPSGTTIYLPTDGSSLGFVAYYPYVALADNKTYTVDVTDQSNQAAIDLMAAAGRTADRTSPAVAFNFVHKLSKVEIALNPGAGMTAGELAGITVELTNQQPKATFDVTVPTMSVMPDTDAAPVDITLHTADDGRSSEGILLPNDGYSGMALKITLSDGKSGFTWPLSESKESDKFEAGNKYLYTITVNKTALEVTATITDWTPGNGDGETGSAE